MSQFVIVTVDTLVSGVSNVNVVTLAVHYLQAAIAPQKRLNRIVMHVAPHVNIVSEPHQPQLSKATDFPQFFLLIKQNF